MRPGTPEPAPSSTGCDPARPNRRPPARDATRHPRTGALQHGMRPGTPEPAPSSTGCDPARPNRRPPARDATRHGQIGAARHRMRPGAPESAPPGTEGRRPVRHGGVAREHPARKPPPAAHTAVRAEPARRQVTEARPARRVRRRRRGRTAGPTSSPTAPHAHHRPSGQRPLTRRHPREPRRRHRARTRHEEPATGGAKGRGRPAHPPPAEWAFARGRSLPTGGGAAP